jgi:hypothetical protein
MLLSFLRKSCFHDYEILFWRFEGQRADQFQTNLFWGLVWVHWSAPAVLDFYIHVFSARSQTGYEGYQFEGTTASDGKHTI